MEKEKPQSKWDKANMKVISYKAPQRIYKPFKTIAEASGLTVSGAVKNLLERVISGEIELH